MTRYINAFAVAKPEAFCRWCSLFVLLFLPFAGSASRSDDTVRLGDDSDWWSASHSSNFDEGLPTQEREFARSNFEILGVNLGENMFSAANMKLSKATAVERGDASTWRRQICYTSVGKQDQVHVVFEQGEVDYTFYLFAGDRTWEGSDRCVPSEAISGRLETASGLHLGQSPAQVVTILGQPTIRRKNELVYSFSVKKKTSPRDLKAARQRHPEMSEKEFEESFASYNLGAGIDAKFADSKLTYLAVSKVESN